jgi:hypothetical protein
MQCVDRLHCEPNVLAKTSGGFPGSVNLPVLDIDSGDAVIEWVTSRPRSATPMSSENRPKALWSMGFEAFTSLMPRGDVPRLEDRPGVRSVLTIRGTPSSVRSRRG